MTSNKNNPPNKNMSHWIIEAEKHGISLNGFHTSKLEDLKLLINSKLPMFETHILPYLDFINSPSYAEDFLKKAPSLVILAIPDTASLPRAHKMGISSYDECKNFLIQKGVDQNKNNYSVVLINPEGENKKGGIIISRDTGLLLEVVDGTVEDISYGINPSISYQIDFTRVGHLEDKVIWNKGGSFEDKKLVKSILSYLTLNPDSFNPLFLRGYFEVVITQTDEIKFIDYKVNKMYLK
ncbi:MAG: hypothetical protein PHT54_01290 [Candidatus Nanoarchaeia archaeon]|nr:hypothetical protein [Candidatus Nanoarchaeia archaeon]